MSLSLPNMNVLVNCMVCIERYNEGNRRPKLLQCGHTFCLRCLEELFKASSRNDVSDRSRHSLACPTCRRVTLIPSINTSNLTDNSAIIGYLSSKMEKEQIFCTKHRDERLKFFCTICQRLLCPSCALNHTSQKPHQVTNVESAAFNYRERIRITLDFCREKQKQLEKTVQEASKQMEQTEGLSQSLEHLMNNASDVELLSQIQTLQELDDCIPCSHASAPILERVPQVITHETNKIENSVPPAFWYISHPGKEEPIISRRYTIKAANYSALFSNKIVQQFSHDKGQELFNCPTGVAVAHDGVMFVTDKTTHTVQTLDCSGKFYTSFNDNQQPNSKWPYCPTGISITSLGYLVLVVECNKQQVSVHARDGQVLFHLKLDWQSPFGVVVNSKGQILVTDSGGLGGLYIMTVDWSSGEILHLQVVRGLMNPWFLSCTQEDNIVVTTNNSVKLFDKAGSLLWSTGPEYGSNQVLQQPMGVCVDRDNHILVSDYAANKVVLLNNEGQWLIDIVTVGLRGPQGLALTPNGGELVIAGSKNHCIKLCKYKSRKHLHI